jgi:protein-disulfide isomerase
VLETKAAKLFGVFGWSEIGLGYFSANLLMLVVTPFFVSFLAIINLFTLPYGIWSIWYQKVKAKQWCPLCLIVQVLLWFIFAVNCLFGWIQIPEFNWDNLLYLAVIVCIYAVWILAFNLIAPILSDGRMIEQLQQEINSIKANEDVFKILLLQQPYYEVNQSDSQILFGDPNAKLRMTVLTNPYCNPCAKMHQRIGKLLQETHEKLCVQYLFSAFDSSLESINKYLIAAYLEKKPETVKHIFNAWFEIGKSSQEAFFKDMHLNIASAEVETEFQKHEIWREQTQLRATPTILVNGYQLPAIYKPEDLKYFTELEIDVN